MNITFIGGGNMATALIAGLQNARPGRLSIKVADPSEDAQKRFREQGIETFARGKTATKDADVIVLAVKPQIMPVVLQELALRHRGRAAGAVYSGGYHDFRNPGGPGRILRGHSIHAEYASPHRPWGERSLCQR